MKRLIKPYEVPDISPNQIDAIDLTFCLACQQGKLVRHSHPERPSEHRTRVQAPVGRVHFPVSPQSKDIYAEFSITVVEEITNNAWNCPYGIRRSRAKSC